MSRKPGFVLYGRQRLLFDHLTLEERGELITAIFDYFEDGVRRESDNRALSMAYGMICEQLDFDSAAYDEKCRKLSKNASKRHLKKAENTIDGICTQSDTETETNTNTDTVTVTEADTDTDTTACGEIRRTEDTPPPTTAAAKENNEKLSALGAFGNVYLSKEDYDELSREFPDTLDKRIDRLSEYIKNSGHHYSSHADVIRRWSKDDHPDRYRTPERSEGFDEDEYFRAALARSARYLDASRKDQKLNTSAGSPES